MLNNIGHVISLGQCNLGIALQGKYLSCFQERMLYKKCREAGRGVRITLYSKRRFRKRYYKDNFITVAGS